MIRYKDLPERPPAGVYLYCRTCGGQYSATRGDYFLRDPTEAIRCGARAGEDLVQVCRTPLKLVQERIIREEISQ